MSPFTITGMWNPRALTATPIASITMRARPLIATGDPGLLDDLLRLCAAGGVEPDVASHAQACARSWPHASIVLIGADLLKGVAALAPRRRPGVVVVSPDHPDATLWRMAVEVGAEHVADLPEAEPWLMARIGEAVHGDIRQGQVVAVMGARGGVGASTLAAAVAFRAAGHGGSSVLVDLDPWGGGIDLALALEDESGARWADLAHTTGRLSAAALADALPRRDGVAVLSWDRTSSPDLPVEAVTAALDGLSRAFELVVADVARGDAPMGREALRRSSFTILVVPREIRAVAAAHRQVQALLALGAPIALVTRGPSPSGLDPEQIAESLGLPLLADLRTEARIAAASERGEPPGGTGRLARVAEAVLAAAQATSLAA